ARHAQAAWRLIESLSEPAVQVRFYALTGNLPPRRTAWREGHLAEDRYAKAFLDQLERARPAPKVPEWERIAREMQLTAEQVVRTGLDIDQATSTLARRGDGMAAKPRWMLARGRWQ